MARTTKWVVSALLALLSLQCRGGTVSTLPAASCFTNRYCIYGTNFITVAPAYAQGIFFQGDWVAISNTLGTTVEVYDFHSNRITNSAPPVILKNLKLGHYFVQVNGVHGGFGDRSEFSVYPKGWTNQPHADLGELPTGTFAESNRFVRLAPGFSRIQQNWLSINTNTGTNNWLRFDQFLHQTVSCGAVGEYWQCWLSPPVPLKVINLTVNHLNQTNDPSAYGSPTVDETNSLTSWVHDVALLYSNAAVQFKNRVVYEVLNEPDWANLVFPTNEDIYGDGTYPAALAVSAAVKAIRFVCPTCQVWGPSALGSRNWTLGTLTNDFVVAYYSHANVDAISFHGGDNNYGQVDNAFSYTNRLDWSPWLSADSGALLYSKMYGRPMVVDETYPSAPSELGRTNSWWITVVSNQSSVPQLSWTWQMMTFRHWKNILLWKGTGVKRILTWLQLASANINDRYPPQCAWCDDQYAGWDSSGLNDDTAGLGPRPTVDGQVMISWWLNNATPLTNWLSGSRLMILTEVGSHTTGTPGLHFWEWRFANGSTNTFIWADEGTSVTTNLGVGVTDIFSNQWTSPIGIEPVIAWNWPTPNRLSKPSHRYR